MSAENELVIVEESSAQTKDSPEVKERFRVIDKRLKWLNYRLRAKWALDHAILVLLNSILD